MCAEWVVRNKVCVTAKTRVTPFNSASLEDLNCCNHFLNDKETFSDSFIDIPWTEIFLVKFSKIFRKFSKIFSEKS